LNKRRFFYSLPIILLLIIVVAGWFATAYLGNKARQEIIKESEASTLTLSIYVSSTLNNLEGAARSLAGSPWIAPALLFGTPQDIVHANSALDRYNSALSASASYLMNADGVTVASSNRYDPDSFVGISYRFRPYFQEAFSGSPYRYFALGITSGKRGFYASHPVRDPQGKVVGVVTMKKDLDEMEAFFSKYPFCFLINPNGIIFLSSNPTMALKTLWPLDTQSKKIFAASRQFGSGSFEAVFEKEIAHGTEVRMEGKGYFVSRKVIDSNGWSVVILTPTERTIIYQLIGMIATISLCFLILVFSGIVYLTDRSREAIRQSEQRYRALFEYTGTAMIIIEQDMTISLANEEFVRRTGYSRQEIEGRKKWTEFVAAEDIEPMIAQHRLRREQPGTAQESYEFRLQTKSGEQRDTLLSVTLLPDTRKSITSLIDITEIKQAEEALRESEERYRTLVENASDIVFRTDDMGHFTFVNPAVLRITGYTEQEIIGKYYKLLIRPDMLDEVVNGLAQQLANRVQNVYYEYPIVTKESHEIWLGQNTQLIVEDGRVTGFQAIARDISERKLMEEKLRDSEKRYHDLSIIDDRTLLYNSRYFYFQLKVEIERANRYEQPLTLLLFDIDDFKAFNDAYGHVEGDQVLARLGQVVKKCLRATDSAYRYGGEEFTILLPMTTSLEGAVIAERFRREFKQENFSPVSGKFLHMTASIGLAQYRPGEDMTAFVHRVDQLMYQAKKQGKDGVCSEA